MMKASALATCATALALLSGSAVAGGYWGNGSGNTYGTYGYGGSYDRYAAFSRGYLRYLRECRRHQHLHGELRELHQEAHNEGFDAAGEHADEHEALSEAHRLYHRDHPMANFCPTYSQYRRHLYDRR